MQNNEYTASWDFRMIVAFAIHGPAMESPHSMPTLELSTDLYCLFDVLGEISCCDGPASGRSPESTSKIPASRGKSRSLGGSSSNPTWKPWKSWLSTEELLRSPILDLQLGTWVRWNWFQEAGIVPLLLPYCPVTANSGIFRGCPGKLDNLVIFRFNKKVNFTEQLCS